MHYCFALLCLLCISVLFHTLIAYQEKTFFELFLCIDHCYNINIKLKLVGFSYRIAHGKVSILLVMQNIYRKAAEFWAEFRLELLSAGESFTEGISNQIWRLYWASHQVLPPYIF